MRARCQRVSAFYRPFSPVPRHSLFCCCNMLLIAVKSFRITFSLNLYRLVWHAHCASTPAACDFSSPVYFFSTSPSSSCTIFCRFFPLYGIAPIHAACAFIAFTRSKKFFSSSFYNSYAIQLEYARIQFILFVYFFSVSLCFECFPKIGMQIGASQQRFHHFNSDNNGIIPWISLNSMSNTKNDFEDAIDSDKLNTRDLWQFLGNEFLFV